MKTRHYISDSAADQRITNGETVHASPGLSEPSLCGMDPSGDQLVLDLSCPRTTPEHRAKVSCQDCLEWMHA